MSRTLLCYRHVPLVAGPSRSLFSTSTLRLQVSWADSTTSWSAPRQDTQRPKRKRMPRVIRHDQMKGPSPEELEKHRIGRIRRAERLERKDLTAQLTETKTYMGGFTQPRHLHFLNTLDPTRRAKDSHDIRVGENRVRPEAEAYEPHTVYLAVTRLPVRWGHGRATRRECFSGFCKESELGERFKELNYGVWKEEESQLVKLAHGRPKEPVVTPAHWHCSSDSKEYLDLAVMPGSPEERSLLNKPISTRIKALMKEFKELGSKPKADPTALDELAKLLQSTRRELLPAVPSGYVRPSPPYLDSRLVVPVLAVTVPTRPLAATLARLCNGHPRGLPFIASIPDEDRKDGPSTFRRLLRMRANRILELTQEIIYKLRGNAGGLMGVRLTPEDRGRGIEGEGLGRDLVEPERGWAEVSWLEAESDIWHGIERESYVASWDGVEGVRHGPNLVEEGTTSAQRTTAMADKVSGPRGADVTVDPIETVEQVV